MTLITGKAVKQPMKGDYTLETQPVWLDAVQPTIDLQGVKVREGAVIRQRAGYLLPHPDSLTTIQSTSTFTYFLLHLIRSYNALVSFVEAAVSSRAHPGVNARYLQDLYTIKTWKNVFNTNVPTSPEVTNLWCKLGWHLPASDDQDIISWNHHELIRSGHLHSSNISHFPSWVNLSLIVYSGSYQKLISVMIS
jgi:hypothetical protein